MTIMLRNLRHTPSYLQYLIFICLVGIVILVLSVIRSFGFQGKINLLLFILLGSVSQVAATTATIKSKTGVTYAISPAVSLAAVPFYGPAAAVLIEAMTSISLWLIKPADDVNWKKSLRQLVFNAAMSITSIFVGSVVYLLAEQMLDIEPWLGNTVPWLLAAIVNDQLNLWILTVMLRLQHGNEFHVFAVWKENAWAIPIGILITSVGGGFLAFSFQQLGWVGISIFFLPLVLSAYAFRLYVSQMQAHMDNLENIVAERTDAMKKLMQEKDEFLAVLTHDMKSPLTTIHLYANMIKEYPQILEKKPHMVDTVLHSQEALTDIVNNILDLEKLKESGQVPMKIETFEYVSVAERVIELVQVQAETKRITLRPFGFDKHIFVHADRHHMERILNNLLTNAIKYTPAEGAITVTLEAHEQQLKLQVQDSGYGIPVEELPHVFERFRRVSAHQKLAAGTGLGLAITKVLVEAAKGSIEVTSQKGEGSCFTARLPIIQQNASGKKGFEASHDMYAGKKEQDVTKATTFISY